jgi:hypothetical protein
MPSGLRASVKFTNCQNDTICQIQVIFWDENYLHYDVSVAHWDTWGNSFAFLYVEGGGYWGY